MTIFVRIRVAPLTVLKETSICEICFLVAALTGDIERFQTSLAFQTVADKLSFYNEFIKEESHLKQMLDELFGKRLLLKGLFIMQPMLNNTLKSDIQFLVVEKRLI